LQYGVSFGKRQHSDVGLMCFALQDLLNGPQREPQVTHPPALTQQTASGFDAEQFLHQVANST